MSRSLLQFQSLQSLMLMLCLCTFSGCAACRPIEGIPVEQVPEEFKLGTRTGRKTIDLSLLKRSEPPVYLVDTGDVLAVYIEGIIGNRSELPPLHVPQQAEAAPALGYPIPVREDGTISIPLTEPIPVRGLTVRGVEQALERRLVGAGILNPNRISVSLQRPRTHRVMVIRQEAGSDLTNSLGGNGFVNPGVIKRGTGHVVALPAYKNDVMHALAETGGLPGLDAENTIYILRRRARNHDCRPYEERIGMHSSPPSARSPIQLLGHEGAATEGIAWGHSAPPVSDTHDGIEEPMPWGTDGTVCDPAFPYGAEFLGDATVESPQIVKIPIRLGPGETPLFCEQDIILRDGDIVFIESRETEIFYTGGLLGGGQYTLPRDYDLDVLGAVSIAESNNQQNQNRRSLGGVSALNQDVTIGASKVVILRKLPHGGQIPIEVDLYDAIRDPHERVVIQPGDHIILQYTKLEAIGAFFERHLLEGALFGVAAASLANN